MSVTLAYEEYLLSPWWRKRRRVFLRKPGNRRCSACDSSLGLEVHHLNYDHLGAERDDDLKTLCRPCHEAVTDVDRADRAYWRGLDTFATKKHGQGWQEFVTLGRARDEFEAWLDSKDRSS